MLDKKRMEGIFASSNTNTYARRGLAVQLPSARQHHYSLWRRKIVVRGNSALVWSRHDLVTAVTSSDNMRRSSGIDKDRLRVCFLLVTPLLDMCNNL